MPFVMPVDCRQIEIPIRCVLLRRSPALALEIDLRQARQCKTSQFTKLGQDDANECRLHASISVGDPYRVGSRFGSKEGAEQMAYDGGKQVHRRWSLSRLP